jgi:hypothetical protein
MWNAKCGDDEVIEVEIKAAAAAAVVVVVVVLVVVVVVGVVVVVQNVQHGKWHYMCREL